MDYDPAAEGAHSRDSTAIIVLMNLFFCLQSYYGVIVPVGVIIQEAMRYGLYVTYSKAEQAIQAVATPNAALPLNLLTSALAAGLGFGTMQGVIMYGSVLAASTGPGVLFVDACPHMPLVMLSAINCLCFIVMNVTLMLVAFGAYRDNNRQRVMTVFLIHLVCSLVVGSLYPCLWYPSSNRIHSFALHADCHQYGGQWLRCVAASPRHHCYWHNRFFRDEERWFPTELNSFVAKGW
jgi:cytochrome bd-type quinol oxidase subunit 2